MVHVEESLQIPRDFEGFGEEGFNPQWPNGARIAVSFVLNYEEGGERSTLDGDAFSEPYLWEKGASGGYKEGARYLNAEQDFEYGSRSASWRLIRLFKEFGWDLHHLRRRLRPQAQPDLCQGPRARRPRDRLPRPAVARHLELLARGGQGVHQAEHPRAQGGVRGDARRRLLWPRHAQHALALPRGLEEPRRRAAVVVRVLQRRRAVLARPPPGRGTGPEEEREGLLLIPYNYDCNDGKFHMSPGFGSPVAETYEQYLKNTFDCLYREGGKLMNIPLHTRIIGKPGRSEALRKFMKYVSDKEGVWVTTRREIAKHMREKFPYKPNGEWVKGV